MTDPFAPDVVAAVLRHMNEDHAEDSLQIVRTLGGQPAATSVRLADISPIGATFVGTTAAGAPYEVLMAWSAEVTERPQFRHEFARMYHEAAAS